MYLILTVGTFFYLLPVWCLGEASGLVGPSVRPHLIHIHILMDDVVQSCSTKACFMLQLIKGSSHVKKELNSGSSVTAGNSTINESTSETIRQKNATNPPHVKDLSGVSDLERHKTAANIAIAVITIVIILMILGMSIYFIRKFQQLSRLTPSYRYSSLKTEINGIDDKAETQALVSVSTDEDDYDDEMQSPPTLRVQSQTVMTNSVVVNGPIIASPLSTTSTMSGAQTETDEIVALDSDDELLQ